MRSAKLRPFERCPREPDSSPYSLHSKLFAAVAVLLLLGLAFLVELSIHEHRELAEETLKRDAIRLVTGIARSNSNGISSGDEETLRVMAMDLMRRPGVVFVRFQSPASESPLTIARTGFSPPPTLFTAMQSERPGSRLARRGQTFLLEVVVPLRAVVPAILLEASSDLMDSTHPASSLTMGFDVTANHAGLRSRANRVRAVQAAVAASILVVLWIVTRGLLRPFEKLAVVAIRIGQGADSFELPQPATHEAHQLTLGLASILRRLERPVGGVRGAPSRLGPRLGTGGPNSGADTEASEASIERAKRAAQGLAPDEDGPPCLGRHVLLVEDNPVNRSVAAELLATLGCTVVCAEDGEASLAAIEAEPFDLVLMDIQMPRMDGLEAARRIRAEEARVGATPTPIVALTAHSQLADRIASAQAGMDDHISKPLTPDDLISAIRKWCASDKTDDSDESSIPTRIGTRND